MEGIHFRTNPSANSSLGFCLLPSEIIQNILLNLALPEINSLRSVSRCLLTIISDRSFVREFNAASGSAPWLFFAKKRWPQDAVLHGFTDRAAQWFKIPIAKLLRPAIFPGEDLYFLTADAGVFLFASNTQRALIAADMNTGRIRKLPPSPLGPRGTSWRRYAMKLVGGQPGSGHFRFLFVEAVGNVPTLFVYGSETDSWRSVEAEDGNPSSEEYGHVTFLNLINGPQRNILIATGSEALGRAAIIRPRFSRVMTAGSDAWTDRLHVYGDGYMIIVRSEDAASDRRMLGSIELLVLMSPDSNGGQWRWEFASKVPADMIKRLRKPYGVLMGCLESRHGTVRTALVSTFEGQWDIIWLSYRVRDRAWAHIPVPDCRMKGSNMAGISFSSGLTLS